MAELIKTFLIHYVNSVDSVNETVIKATTAEEAKRILKQKFRGDVRRVINIRELINSNFDLVGNMTDAFNELDKLWEEFSESLTESKTDTQKLVDFAGADLAGRFFDIKNKLKAPENDLYYWIKNKSIEELEQTVNKIENTKSNTQIKKDAAENGAELVCKTDHWKVYHITTYEAAQAYGRDTHWCITGINEWGDKYWREYKEKGIDFYFLITKDRYNPRGFDSKFALAIYPDNKTCEVFNQKDGQVSIYDIKYIYEVKIPGIDLENLDDQIVECIRCGEQISRNEEQDGYCVYCYDEMFG